MAPPQRQRLPQHEGRGGRVGLGERPTLRRHLLEPQRIYILWIDLQQIARRPGQQDGPLGALLPRRLQGLAQRRDVNP